MLRPRVTDCAKGPVYSRSGHGTTGLAAGQGMETVWCVIYGVVAALAIVQSVLVLIQSWEHRRFARNRFSQLYRYRPRGRVMVYVPCRGVDVGLEKNLRRLLNQDHDDYEVTFIVESTTDPAYWLIRRLMVEHPRVQISLVIAGLADGCGQKVHNLRVATAEIPSEIEYLAFMDSDARPRRQWLRALVSHLDDPRIGAATGYRWFIPVQSTFAQRLVYSINCNVAVLFRSRSPNLIWGGSWALRREVFESLRVRDALDGMLTEDLVGTETVRKHGLRVEFEPACMVSSPLDGGFRTLLPFLRRQYMLGRYYATTWWWLGFAAVLSSNITMLTSLVALTWRVAAGSPLAWIPAWVCAALYGLHVTRGIVRQDLVRIYCPDLEPRLRKAARLDIWAGPLVSLVSCVALLTSAIGQRVAWRGITYCLSPDGRTRILERNDTVHRHDEADSPADQEDGMHPFRYRKAG